MATTCSRLSRPKACRTVGWLLLLASLYIVLTALPSAAQNLIVTPLDPEQDGIFKSADGSMLAFESDKPLVPEDTNGSSDVYVKNLNTGDTVLASIYQGQTIAVPSGLSVDSGSSGISFASNPISADGRFVYFFIVDGSSTYLVRRDLVSNTTQEVSTDGVYWSDVKVGSKVSVSADGRYALYATYGPGFNETLWVLRDMAQNTRQEMNVYSTEMDCRLTSDGSRVLYRLRNNGSSAPFGFIDRDNFSDTVSSIPPLQPQMVGTVDGAPNDLNDPSLIYFDQFASNKAGNRITATFASPTADYNWLQYADTSSGSAAFADPSGFGAATSAQLTGSTSFGVGPFAMSDDGRFLVFTYGIYAAYLADTATGQVVSLPVSLTIGKGDASITGDGKKIFLDGQIVLNPFADQTALAPASKEFGVIGAGTTSTAVPFTLSNSGTASITVGSVSLAGPNASEFAIASDSCSRSTIAAGGSCSVSVTFTPGGTGARSATLTLPAGSGQLAAPLSGSGGFALDVTRTGDGTVTSSPAGISCGPACNGAFAPGATVTLTATPATGATFNGWSGAGCSGTGSCVVTLDQAKAVTADFSGGTSGCWQAIGDLVVTGTSCQKYTGSSDFSGAIGIAHKDAPNNPMLKMDNGTLHIDNGYSRISIPLGGGASLLYVPGVAGIGNVPLGATFTFDVSGAKLQTPTDQSQIVFEGVQKLTDLLFGFSLSLDSVTLAPASAQVEGKLSSSFLASKMFTYMDNTQEKPVQVAAAVTLSQSAGVTLDRASVTATEMSVAGSPVALKDVAVGIDYQKSAFSIGGLLSIKHVLDGAGLGGKISLMSGKLDALTLTGKGLNVQLGSSPVFLNQAQGSVEGLVAPPVVIKGKASFSGGPEIMNGFKALCANDVGFEIDTSSKLSYAGGLGLLCMDSWESYKNGAVSMQVDSSYNWQTNNFQLEGNILFPYDILKGKAKLSITPNDITGTTTGTFCAPKGTWMLGGTCVTEQNGIINKKGIGESIRILSGELAVFAEWATFTDSIGNVPSHLHVGTNLYQLAAQAKRARREADGGARGVARATGPDGIAVPPGLGFAIIRVAWQSGTTDISLTAPDGTAITPAYAAEHPNDVKYMKLDSEAWYALNNPAAGNWLVGLAQPEAIGDYTVSLNTLKARPSVTVISPATPTSSSSSVAIGYAASAPDSTPTIALYYGKEASGGTGVKIVDGLPAPSGTGSYTWDVSAVPPGTYYVFAVIDDGLNVPVINYAPGTVQVTKGSAPAAPANLAANVNGTAIDLSWTAVNGAAGYHVYATDNPAVASYPVEIALAGSSTSYTLANMKPATSYRVTVSAFDAAGVEGGQAAPLSVSTADLPAPVIGTSAGAIDFGTVTIGETRTSGLTITNSGQADLTITGAQLSGANSSLLSIPDLPTPAVIPAGQSRAVTVTLQASASGSLNASLLLDSNDPATPRKSVALTASTPYQSYTLSFAGSEGGGLTGSTTQQISNGGSAAAVTAVPAAGYHFVNWTGSNGFVTSTDNPLTVGNVTASQAITANFAADSVAGVCGTSNGALFAAQPDTALCATGTPSAVTGSGPWSWSCQGSGGASALCAALKLRAGDCDRNGEVSIAEVQGAINMFLGMNTVAACVDTDGSGGVDIAEVQKAINGFLGL